MGVLGNRVKVATATTGQGSLALGAAEPGYFSFAEAGVADATALIRYVIEEGNDVEIGLGTYATAGPTLSRDTVIASKIAGVAGTTKLTLAGAAKVFIDALAQDVWIPSVANRFPYSTAAGVFAEDDITLAGRDFLGAGNDGTQQEAMRAAAEYRVRVATTVNINIATALNDGDVLDGVTLALTDRALVKNQTVPAENGVYTVAAVPARPEAWDSYDRIAGRFVIVQEGVSNADSMWLCPSNPGGTLDTTAIRWVRIPRPSTYAKVASTTNVVLATGLDAGDTVNGVVLAAGDVALLTGQTAPAENGLYLILASGAGIRHPWFNTYDSHCGAIVIVDLGTVKANSIWLDTDSCGGTLDTTAINFVELGAPASETVAGILEIATGAEVTAGSDDQRAVTPAKLQDKLTTLLMFGPLSYEPPATNYATLDFRNGHPVLDFNDTTQYAAIWTGVLPRTYGGNGITVYVHWAATSAVTGTIGWDVSFERIGDGAQDLDADGFATAQVVTAVTVPATSGNVDITNVAISDGANIDSIAVGEAFRIRVRRDVANDNAVGDGELLFVELRET